MATTIHYTSINNPNDVIIVTHNSGWRAIKIYAKGKLQFKDDNGDQLRSGKDIEVEGLGTVQIFLGNDLEIRVNGERFNASRAQAKTKVANVSAIFWLLTGFSLIGLLFLFLALNSILAATDVIQGLIVLQVFAILIYSLTAILLQRGVYWFYFVGASVYTLFSLWMLTDLETQLSTMPTIIALIIRYVLLILVLRLIPTILREMRSKQESLKDIEILDQR